MFSVRFDAKLAQLEAYLQMLINENELLDKKLSDFPRISHATISNHDQHKLKELVGIKNNLQALLKSIEHSIALFRIARNSSRNSFLSLTADQKPHRRRPKLSTPSPKSILRLLKRTPFRSSSKKNRHKASRLATRSRTQDESVSSCSSAPSAPLDFVSHLNPKRPHVLGPHRADESFISNHDDGFSSIAGTSKQLLPGRVTKIDQCGGASKSERGTGRQHKGQVTNNCDPAVKDETTSSSKLRGDGYLNNSNYHHSSDDDDYEDEEDFFDAIDVQYNQSKSFLSSSSTLESLSSDQTSHPDGGHLVAFKKTTNRNNHLMSRDPIDNIMNETNNNIESRACDAAVDWDTFYEEEEEEELDNLDGQGSVIKHLLSQIRVGMDLTKVVLPTFILERRSLLEMYADFFAHPDLFSAIPDFDTAEERMVQLVRWYLSAFHAGRKSSLAKKPYNPILGEVFRCQWKLEPDNEPNRKSIDPSRTTNNNHNNEASDSHSQQLLTFVAEQVSHHPPVSAFYAENKDKGISCCAHIYTKSKFLGLSVGVHNIGQGVIKLSRHNETYICTFPSAYGRSILTVPWVELGGPVSITCEQTGYKANIEFQMKPFYGGKKHRVTGEVLRPNDESIITIDGEWNGVMHSKPTRGSKQVFVDTTNLPVIKKYVKPVSNQDSFESRNVWKEVTRALKMRDVNNATAAKTSIEQRQRDQLKERLERGIKWRTKYFEPAGDSWQYLEKVDRSG